MSNTFHSPLQSTCTLTLSNSLEVGPFPSCRTDRKLGRGFLSRCDPQSGHREYTRWNLGGEADQTSAFQAARGEIPCPFGSTTFYWAHYFDGSGMIRPPFFHLFLFLTGRVPLETQPTQRNGCPLLASPFFYFGSVSGGGLTSENGTSVVSLEPT